MKWAGTFLFYCLTSVFSSKRGLSSAESTQVSWSLEQRHSFFTDLLFLSLLSSKEKFPLWICCTMKMAHVLHHYCSLNFVYAVKYKKTKYKYFHIRKI